ncbi:MAG: hypothetical protein MZV70_29740 [Desulfobacterales bacterium]|nr:hypothetical protein [Desulfobacterales bacterium]
MALVQTRPRARRWSRRYLVRARPENRGAVTGRQGIRTRRSIPVTSGHRPGD